MTGEQHGIQRGADILVHGWNRVRPTLTTHSAGRPTDDDRAMAATMEGLV